MRFPRVANLISDESQATTHPREDLRGSPFPQNPAGPWRAALLSAGRRFWERDSLHREQNIEMMVIIFLWVGFFPPPYYKDIS